MTALGTLSVEFEGGKRAYRPGETIAGTATWRLSEAPEGLEVRLFWYTEGKGDRDLEIVETVTLGQAGAGGVEGSREFFVTAPRAPYSFSGKLISLRWAIELVRLPDGEAAREIVTISPSGDEIRIGRP